MQSSIVMGLPPAAASTSTAKRVTLRSCPHPSIFTKVGLDPFGEATKVVVLKSGTGWQTTYEGKCAAMIRADCPGPMNYNVASFPWEQVARPIYPLDEAMEWAAEAGGGGARL